MAINQTKLGRMRIIDEGTTYSALTTAEASFASSGVVIECGIPAIALATEIFEREVVTGGFYELPRIEGSKHGGTLTFTADLVGWSTTTPSGNPTEHGLAKLLKAALGASVQSGYGEDAALNTGSSTSVTAADDGAFAASNWKIGSAIAVDTVSSGGTQVQWISDITDGTPIDLAISPYSDNVANDATIFGSNTIYLDHADATQPRVFSVEYQMATAENRYVFGGCCVQSANISADPKGLLQCEFTLLFNSVTELAAAADLDDYAVTANVVPVAIGSNKARFRMGSTSPADVAVESFSIAIENELRPRKDHNATSGVGGMSLRNRMVTVSFNRLLEDSLTLKTGLTASPEPIQFDCGDTPGAMFSAYLPSPLDVSVESPSDSDGAWAQAYSYKVGRYAGDAASTNAGNSGFRIAFI